MSAARDAAHARGSIEALEFDLGTRPDDAGNSALELTACLRERNAVPMLPGNEAKEGSEG